MILPGRLWARRALTGMACAVALALPAQGQVVVLTDTNGVAAAVNAGTSRGLFQFGSLSGGSFVKQQWFWYRIGTNDPESSIDTISPPIVTQPDSRRANV